MTLDVVTFGCRLNAYESEQVRAQAAADGVADTVVFNTCAVTSEAVRQARQAIRKARRERPGERIVVTGCAAQVDPQSFVAMPEVDLVLGNAEKAEPGALATSERVRVGDIMQLRQSPSRPVGGLTERVVAEVRSLANAGYVEVVLTGVDLTSWGADLPDAPPLGRLVRRILGEVPELPRLRLSSIDAAEIDAELMACLEDEPRLCPHLHLSLQSGDDLILKRMKRRHSSADALRLIESVRAVRPETAFGADFIAGFPTETDAAFENTVAFVATAGSWDTATTLVKAPGSNNVFKLSWWSISGKVRRAKRTLASMVNDDLSAVNAIGIAVHNLVKSLRRMRALYSDANLRQTLSAAEAANRSLVAPVSIFRQAIMAGEVNGSQYSNGSLFILNIGDAAGVEGAGSLVFMRDSWSSCPAEEWVPAMLEGVWVRAKTQD